MGDIHHEKSTFSPPLTPEGQITQNLSEGLELKHAKTIIQARDIEIEALKRELAEARKPWWKRLR